MWITFSSSWLATSGCSTAVFKSWICAAVWLLTPKKRTLPARWGVWGRDESALMNEALAAGKPTTTLAAANAKLTEKEFVGFDRPM